MSPNKSFEAPTPSPNLQLGPLAALVTSLIFGAALGLAVLELSFGSIPTDVARLGVLTQALSSESPTPEVVVFGNSAMMSGFDANAFRQSSPDASLAWNCASTGQTLTEAALLTQELPDSVERVVYALQVRAGPADKLIHPNKFNTFYMGGLRPTSDTREMLRSLGNAELNGLLEDSWLEHVVASRWAVRQLIDRMSRQLLRSDLELEHATIDLFHPQAYAKPIKESITASFIAGRNKTYAQKSACCLRKPSNSLAPSLNKVLRRGDRPSSSFLRRILGSSPLTRRPSLRSSMTSEFECCTCQGRMY